MSDEVAGKSYPSIIAAARRFDIPKSTFSKRLRVGDTPEQAAALEQRAYGAGRDGGQGVRRSVIVKGETFESMRKAADHYGVSRSRAYYRMKQGATPEQAFGLVPFSTAFSVEFKGKKYESMKALAQEYGQNVDTVRSRVNWLGWTLEEALETEDRQKSSVSKGLYNEKFFERNPEEKDHPAVVYFVYITHAASGRSFSKIGITARTLEGRLAKAAGYTYEEITSKETTLYDAWQLEQMILEDYSGCGIIWQETDFGGRTECFDFSDEQIAEICQLIDEL